MRRNLDDIEIVEPPMEELTKRRSWKGACFTSCLFLIFLSVITVVGIRFYVGPGPQTSKGIPTNFPADIPVYDKDSIENIVTISARYKERGLGIATLVPKLILSPVFYNADNSTNGDYLKNIWKAVATPSGNYRDSIQIEWKNINADPSFVIAYYKKELKKKNFKIDIESEGKKVQQFSFSREDGLDGSIFVQVDNEKKSGTDYMILTLNLPKI
jgi:hypothetical protein